MWLYDALNLTAVLKEKNIDHKILQTKTSYKGKALFVVILILELQEKRKKFDLTEEGLKNELRILFIPKMKSFITNMKNMRRVKFV